jgi:protein-disulfide isomerase
VVNDAKRDKILTYIRERFGVPDTIKLSLSPLHPSAVAPGFSEATVTSNDGKTERSQQLLVSNDFHLLIVVVGSVMELQQKTPAQMEQRIRETFKTPASVKVTVGGFEPSPSPAFQQGTLTIDDGRSKQDRMVLLPRDGKHLILSDLYDLSVNPRQQALHTISLNDEPTQGPADAPVTIVEYADLQCPTCARLHEFMETKVVPRYGNKVRIVFKEFPLVGIHDWSYTAAIADQCAFEINPSAYVPMRTAIFRSQALINITNLRDTLLSFGEQAGVDRVQLAGCLDSKASLPRVQRDMDEGKRINMTQTPTAFINGKMMLGLPSEDAYFQAIDLALRGK